MATSNNIDHTRAHSITAYSRHICANDATSNQSRCRLFPGNQN